MQVDFVNLGLQYESLKAEILERFDAISRSGAYVLSREVDLFEEEFAAMCGTRFAVAVASGADALYLGMQGLGVGPEHEVITAPNSFIASAGSIARLGARVVFADVAEDYNLDPEQVERAITPRTRALMPVHLTGRVAPMDELQELAERHNLLIIEDAAQAVGARYRGRVAGSFGHCAGFSLHPLKNLHVHGDGGVITTSDPNLYEWLRKARNHGLRNRDECEFWGINSRLDAIWAAVGRLKLGHLAAYNARFREIAGRYSAALAGHVQVPSDRDYEESIYHRYVIRHPERDRLADFLKERGVDTRVNYPIPLHLQPAARELGYGVGSFPVTEALAESILSLPIYPELTDAQVDHVIASVQAFREVA